MPPKRTLSAADQHRLRALLQSATLGALMDSRRWQPGELAFQGGTCLHLAYGSARFSEDLDFMVRGGLSIKGLGAAVQRRLQRLQGVPADMTVTVASGRDGRNPHSFTVTLAGASVMGSAKVKVELWQTPATTLDTLKLVVKPIPSLTGATAFVPSLAVNEIFADKVYALGARTRLKARDVFDLWWLCEQQPQAGFSETDLCARLDIYPVDSGDRVSTAQTWLASAMLRATALSTAATVPAVKADLQRWLPSSWRMDDAAAQQMVDVASAQLQSGIAMMAAHLRHQPAPPPPSAALQP